MKTNLRSYPLFIGLTRPPMIFGVTQTFFILSVMPCAILFFMTMHIFLAAILYILLHLIGMLCCWHDEFMFHIILGKLELLCRNHDYWGCNSYDPQ